MRGCSRASDKNPARGNAYPAEPSTGARWRRPRTATPIARPGSGLYRHSRPLFRAAIAALDAVPFLGTSAADGAKGLVYLADGEAAADTTGAYFRGARREEPDERVADHERRGRVWSVSASLAGVDSDWP